VICGVTDRFSAFAVVQANLAPIARPVASPASGAIEGGTVDFGGAASSDEDGSIIRYEWDWENDGVFDGAGVSLSHVFTQDGTHHVALRVTDDQGAMHVATVDVAVANVLPTVTVDATLEPVALSGGTVRVPVNVAIADPGTLDPQVVMVACGNETAAAGSPLSCAYTVPGVYAITATVNDDDGQQSATFEYVVVYDPNGGFVTGGGWVNSPAGACSWSGCATDGSTAGKASFGFVAKYQRGASVPSGDTEFQFKAGNLNFGSTSYQWLVVSGPRAQYKGEGTINGQGRYGFLLSAVDGQLSSGGGTDKFRIKIWDPNDNDRVVYDNQWGTPDTTDPTTALGGGSIVIHVK